MNILIAPNYYKGSLSALKASDKICDAIKSKNQSISVTKCPLADGGDGTIESIYSATGGEFIITRVKDPLLREINAVWLKQGNTAIIEAAKANGSSLLKQDELNPHKATSYGVGELILDSIKKGCKKIIIGVGGSATNDAGYGALRALGVRFLKKDNTEINFDISSFLELSEIDTTNINPALKKIEIIVAADVTNPLTGSNGASMIFARQKGAKESELEHLDTLLSYFADISSEYLHKDNRNLSGAGAAGGLAYGLSEYLGSKIVGGFNLISKLCGLDDKIKVADLVITGEGRLDEQSLLGKAPIKVAELCQKYNKPCVVIAGSKDSKVDWNKYFKAVFTLTDKKIDTEYAMKYTENLLVILVKEKLNINELV